jgi:hypothetical protein
MHTSSVDPIEQVRAVGARFSEQRERWSLEPDGYAVYWEELDDGIEVQHILEAQPIA